jgi:hypothetical protein
MLVLVALLAGLACWLGDVANGPARELITVVGLGGVLMLPELFYQLGQFFSSGAPPDD